MNAGLKRSICLEILGLTRHQLSYKPNGRRVGVANSVTTKKLIDNKGNIQWVHEDTIVKEIITIKENPDLGNWYRLICAQLNFLGYYINHKKDCPKLLCNYNVKCLKHDPSEQKEKA